MITIEAFFNKVR